MRRMRAPFARNVRRPGVLALGLAVVGLALRFLAADAVTETGGFTNFETEPVRPLAMAPDGSRLFALNTADDRLEVLSPTADGLVRVGEVAVGLRPVAVAARSADEVWVVNHLSDSVSVVDTSDPERPRVVRTIQVGDEPRDIVVAGSNRDMILVATARRAELTTPGAGRGSVWSIAAEGLGQGSPPVEVAVLATKLRALAVSADGRTAYAAVFKSGNRTAIIEPATFDRLPPTFAPTVAAGTATAAISPTPTGTATAAVSPTPSVTPTLAFPTASAPSTGRIFRQQPDGAWHDEAHQLVGALPFTLPDADVFVLDVQGTAVRLQEQRVAGVGTILFNMAVQPGTGELWVTHQEANNLTRHEPRLRGKAVDHRIARLRPSTAGTGFDVQAVRLNPHRDQSPDQPLLTNEADAAQTLAQPLDIAFAVDGQRAYVTAFQSGQVAVLDAIGQVVDRIDVGFGPGGLVLDHGRGRMYVLNHLDATISVVDLARGAVVGTVPLAFDPTPDVVRAGRPFFYGARLASATGDQSCAGCHVFGDMDGLAWDLGDPDGAVDAMPFEITHDNFVLKPRRFTFHPEKGPMVTQSFRGLDGTGPLHWRGDRFGPPGRRSESLAAFARFNGAFVSLNGRAEELAPEEMEAFGRFILTLRYPPNPVQQLDRSLTPAEARGLALFDGPDLIDSGVSNCAGCHALPLGTNGRINFDGNAVSQDFKAPHLRGLYEKVGRFDVAGPQVSGFGFTHDGAFDTIEHFLASDVFDFPVRQGYEVAAMRADLTAFLMAFDTGMAPAVGWQLTVSQPLAGEERRSLDVVVARAAAGDCDLVARGWRGAREHGWLLGGGGFVPDRRDAPTLALPDLLVDAVAPGQATTLLCVPPGDGVRSTLDRDQDGHRNGDELAAGTDPADPASYPGAPSPSPTAPPPTATEELPLPTTTIERPAHVAWLPVATR